MSYGKFCLLFGLVLTMKSAVAYSHPQMMAYRSFLPELEETARFAEMGIPLRTVFIANTVSANGLPYCQYPMVWKQFGEYDFDPVDQQFGDIIKASPKAEFIVMLDLNTPVWMTRRLRHDSYNELTHVLSLPQYREEARDYLDKLIRYIEKGYGKRVKGYILMCGLTSEWFETAPRQSHAKNLAWRKWCTERGLKYGKSTPREDELATAAFENVIYDPATEQEKIDYWRFHNWIISDAVLEFSKVTKRASNGKLTGADFGYYMICNKEPCGVGNLDYERVVASPDFDLIVSPATYTGREIGGGTGSQLVAGTSRRYGKRFYYSIDFWPHSLQNPYGWKQYFHSWPETLAGNTRNAAFAIIQHADFHWFDMWGGFYRDPGMCERIAKLAKIQKRFEMDDSAPDADVLVVADPDSLYGHIDWMMAGSEDENAMCPDGFMPSLGCGEAFRNIINRLGVVYDVYSFNDLPHVDLKRFKAVILSDVWTITPEKESVLRDCILKDDRTAVWVYAPGISDGKDLDVKRIRKWSGADFKTPEVTTTDMGGWKAVYAYDYRTLTQERLRGVLKAAGCHFWTDDPTPVMANEHLLSVHVKNGGRRMIHLPRKTMKVVDLLADKTVAENVDAFEVEFDTPDTKIFELVR